MRYVFSLLLVLATYSPSNAQTDDIVGDWHVNANSFRMTISLTRQGEGYTAYLINSYGGNETLDQVTAENNAVEFRRPLNGFTQWYRVAIEDGVMVGRFSYIPGGGLSKPTDPLAYKYQITGWKDDYFPITPVVFDISAIGYRGRLRIDRQGGEFVGRLKFYAIGNTLSEKLEEDITVNHWDGEHLEFTRPSCSQVYTGEVEGATISGTFTHQGGVYQWSGHRAEVLTYGLAPKTTEERDAWQERTRRTLRRLMMAGDPQPASVNVEILCENLPPIESKPYELRDDDPAKHPQIYTLTELRLTYTIPGQFGLSARTVHAYLAKPTMPPPAGLSRYPLVVAVNGHLGSAYKVMDGGGLFWYGDAWARQGYMVLAVDIGHRPIVDVLQFGSVADLSTYLGYAYPMDPGDDPAHGNGLHSSIKPVKPEGYSDADWAYYTDWEEDGERVWDVMRAIDYAVSRSDVDPERIAVTGLSLGGEVASYVGALDIRVKAVIPAGYSPDLNVVLYKAAGHCWHWSFADFREYLDHSDVLALIAPRPLIVESGMTDNAYSVFPSPFAADKQVMRRARVAGGTLFHYLHPIGHEYRAGVVRYAVVTEPVSPGDLTWQTNADTATDGRTLFDYVRAFLNF